MRGVDPAVVVDVGSVAQQQVHQLVVAEAESNLKVKVLWVRQNEPEGARGLTAVPADI